MNGVQFQEAAPGKFLADGPAPHGWRSWISLHILAPQVDCFCNDTSSRTSSFRLPARRVKRRQLRFVQQLKLYTVTYFARGNGSCSPCPRRAGGHCVAAIKYLSAARLDFHVPRFLALSKTSCVIPHAVADLGYR